MTYIKYKVCSKCGQVTGKDETTGDASETMITYVKDETHKCELSERVNKKNRDMR